MTTRVQNNKKQRQKIIKEVNQRRFKKIFKVLVIIFLSLTSITLYSYFIGAKRIVVKEYKITNEIIPSSFHGVKVLQFSDLLYDSLKENDLINLKEKINDLKADILIFTGDIKKKDYELTKEDIKILEDFMKDLQANIKKYAIIGDNDNEYYKIIMENSGFSVLNNQSELVFYKDITPINIIGLNSNNLNLEIENSEYYTICLIHDPDLINDLTNLNCNLTLAGDTLGGEIKLGNSCLLTDNKYCLDYYDFNNNKLYISNGLGNNYGFRLNNHPSISLYRLTKY